MVRDNRSIQIFPDLDPDERSVLERRGACKLAPKTGWKAGRFFLTEKRLLFAHGGHFLMTIPYHQITAVRLKGRFPPRGGRNVLELTCGDHNGANLSRVWLAVNDATSLAQWLCCIRTPPLLEEAIHEIVTRLGESGKVLIQHVSRKRHVTTEDLARLLQKKPRDVPRQIERSINDTARRIIGRDLVVLRESWFDAQAADCIRNNWWLTYPLESIGAPDGPCL